MQIVIVILWDGYYLHSYLGDEKKSCMTHSRNARLRNRRCVVGQWKGMNMGTSFKVFPRNWEEKKRIVWERKTSLRPIQNFHSREMTMVAGA